MPPKPRLITHGNVSRTLNEWAEEIGIAPGTIQARIRLGFPMDKVLAPKHLPRVDRINAAKKRCIRGHPFTVANTHITKDGKRKCRACQRMHNLKSRQSFR